MKLVQILLLALLVTLAMAQADPAPVAPGREEPGKPIEHTKADDVLEEIQGGKADVFVIVFSVDQAKGDELKGDIETALKEEHGWIRTAVVDFTKIEDYYKLFKVLKIEGEPKRGHSAPQVLVMSKGEGFIIRGPRIVEGIQKRIKRVEDGTLFGQGTTGKTGGNGYSFNGRR